MIPTLLFHCQHSLGLGHLARSLTLAAALRERFRVVLLAGGELPLGLEPPDGVELVPLPPLGIGDNGELVSRDGRFTVERALQLRRDLVVHALRSTRPEIVLVELFPFGRKKLAGELLPLLEEAHALGRRRPLVLCSLRDILVRGRRNQAAHDQRASTIANRFLDAVLVHADPDFTRLEESFQPETPLRVPVRYTGFVAPDEPALTPRTRRGPLLVSAGGGLVGASLFRAAVEAHDLLGLPMRLVAGPFLPARHWQELASAAEARPRLELVRAVTNLAQELAAAPASVSQCGYNTALDLLRSRVPALVVPYAEGGEDEQRRRAERLRRLGAVRVLDPSALTGLRLAAELRALGSFRPQPVDLRLNGASATVRIVAELTAARTGAAVA